MHQLPSYLGVILAAALYGLWICSCIRRWLRYIVLTTIRWPRC